MEVYNHYSVNNELKYLIKEGDNLIMKLILIM